MAKALYFGSSPWASQKCTFPGVISPMCVAQEAFFPPDNQLLMCQSQTAALRAVVCAAFQPKACKPWPESQG